MSDDETGPVPGAVGPISGGSEDGPDTPAARNQADITTGADGRPDLLICGYDCTALYHNEGGGRFREVTDGSGLEVHHPPAGKCPEWRTSAGFVDYDNDAARTAIEVAAVGALLERPDGFDIAPLQGAQQRIRERCPADGNAAPSPELSCARWSSPICTRSTKPKAAPSHSTAARTSG